MRQIKHMKHCSIGNESLLELVIYEMIGSKKFTPKSTLIIYLLLGVIFILGIGCKMGIFFWSKHISTVGEIPKGESIVSGLYDYFIELLFPFLMLNAHVQSKHNPLNDN